MGLKIKGLVESVVRTITIENLLNKTIAIDGFNVIYQLLFSVRDSRGNLLKNFNGDITSHLSGLFYKNIKFLNEGITPIYCLDGKDKKFKIARSSSSVSLTDEMIEQAKRLFDYMGIHYIQCPSEGEAQCVEMVKNEDAWGVASQDYDVLLYGGTRMVRNLTLSNKELEFISLPKFLESNKITQGQFIELSILIGNDFFPGVSGLGEKKGLKLLLDNGSINKIRFDGKIDLKDKTVINKQDFRDRVSQVKDLILNPVIDTDYKNKIKRKKKPDYDKLLEFLVEENNFDEKRTGTSVNKYRNLMTQSRQVSIFEFSTKNNSTPKITSEIDKILKVPDSDKFNSEKVNLIKKNEELVINADIKIPDRAILKCPSCGSVNIESDRSYICIRCGCIFVWDGGEYVIEGQDGEIEEDYIYELIEEFDDEDNEFSECFNDKIRELKESRKKKKKPKLKPSFNSNERRMF